MLRDASLITALRSTAVGKKLLIATIVRDLFTDGDLLSIYVAPL